MKIYIPFKPKATGGTSSFALKFKAGMEKRGHEVTFDSTKDYDVLFLIVQGPLSDLIYAKLNKKKIFQRLDGVYYWSVSGWRFLLLNLKAMIIRHLLASHTIYQSQYSKLCCNLFLLPKIYEKSTLIYNGIDTKIFSPKGKKINLRDKVSQPVFITVSDFRRLDQISPLINLVKMFRLKYNPNTKFIIIGNFRGQVASYPGQFSDDNLLEFKGLVPNSLLPEYLRSADIFLHSHLNPPCPNNVLEAMACGLPICGVGDGAMPELIENGKEGQLLPVLGNAFWFQRKYNIEKFADNLAIVLSKRQQYRANCLKTTTSRFTLVDMIGQYEKCFNNSI